MSVMTTERMRGLEVVDRDQQRVGTIRDLVVDPESESVRHALLGPGGALTALGVVERIIPIPFEALSFHEGVVTLKASAEELRDAPSCSPYVPLALGQEFETSLYEHWGIPPYWAAATYRMGERRVSEFVIQRGVPSIAPDATMGEALALIRETGAAQLAVVDRDGRFHGILAAAALLAFVPGASRAAGASREAGASGETGGAAATAAPAASGEARRSPFRTSRAEQNGPAPRSQS